ncbi:MAG TPA: response regulator transcription factor [Bacteroidetes bacterium]|nr:response regulator transcription factor [Bacteroidota bacterium]
MSKFKVLIADDEELARKKMKRLLSKFEDFEIVEEAANGEEALQMIKKKKPDIAFLDIEMPGLNGIEVAAALVDEDIPYIVFATAYNEHAIKAFELNAIDYLLKPFNEERLGSCLEKIKSSPRGKFLTQQKKGIKRLESSTESFLPFSNKIPIPTFDRYKLVDHDEVVCIEVEERNTILYTADKSYTLNQTLDYFEKKLPSEKFLRVNRSSLIGLLHVKEIVIWFGNRFKIILTNGKEVISSREKSKILKQVLKF